MDRQELINILRSGNGGYPNSTELYNDENYINLIQDFLIYTEYVNTMSNNANDYAMNNKDDKEKRQKDQKLISILDKNRNNMWKEIANYSCKKK